MRRLLIRAGAGLAVAVLLAAALAPLAVDAQDRAPDADATYFPREVLAVTETAAAAGALTQAAAGIGYTLLNRANLPALDLTLLKFEYPAGREGPEAILELEALGVEATIGVNHLYGLAQATRSSRDYAAALTGWPEAGCQAAAIGVIDTGLGDGPAQKGVVEASFLAEGDRASIADHGAGIASLLRGGSARAGLTPSARLYIAAVAEETADGRIYVRVERVARALDWLSGEGVRVANISLAGPNNRILRRTIAAAAERGLILVAAAGNDGPDAKPAYPAAIPEVISVTAVDARLKVYDGANRGDYVDFAAPGVDVWVATADGAARYASGTSFAAPFVAAAISADLAARPGEAADVAAIRARLAARALDLGAPNRDPVFGFGLVKAPLDCSG